MLKLRFILRIVILLIILNEIVIQVMINKNGREVTVAGFAIACNHTVVNLEGMPD